MGVRRRRRRRGKDTRFRSVFAREKRRYWDRRKEGGKGERMGGQEWGRGWAGREGDQKGRPCAGISGLVRKVAEHIIFENTVVSESQNARVWGVCDQAATNEVPNPHPPAPACAHTNSLTNF